MITSIKAQDKWYHVEILVFENNDKNALAEEWPLDPGKPALKQAMTLVTEPNTEYSQLDDKQLLLNAAKRKIQNNYRLILHKGWRQILTDKGHAQNVRLIGGKQYSNNDMTGEMPIGGNQYEVDGIIRFSGGKFLHVDSDLLFRKPVTIVSPEGATTAKFTEIADKNNWQNQPNAKLQTFRMKESARLRLEEIQYIDHPLYGVIIMVSQEKA